MSESGPYFSATYCVAKNGVGHIANTYNEGAEDNGAAVASRITSCLNACEGIPDPAAAIAAAREALEDVLRRVENSEAWWMDSPDRGGMDVDKIEKALALLNGQQP